MISFYIRKNCLVPLLVFCLISPLIGSCAHAPCPEQLQSAHSDVEQYIDETWNTLTRSPLNCGALVDPKVPQGESILYIPAEQPITAEMRSAAAKCNVKILPLNPGEQPQAPGLLYLPKPYVVPGGRFNEMYGWDSYFIVEGLIQSGRFDLARDMTENFFYQLDHYHAILNANRSYYSPGNWVSPPMPLPGAPKPNPANPPS